MKAAPLLVSWHDENAPIYSAHFEPHGKERLATGGGDHLVRLWRIEANGEERKVTYLSTLAKHTQAVNVVRWSPRGELLASAGDDGNVLLWIPADPATYQPSFGEDNSDDVETWRVKTMCRSSSGSEIYDLAWSPDGTYFITGSMDNIARIYNASNGTCVRQIAEHNHYVQGVAWDPLNEYVATQSSDRSVHIYTLKTRDGQFSLAQHNKVTKMDMPARRISSNSPAPPDFGIMSNHRALLQDSTHAIGSPLPSAPGTPQSLAIPMNPPPTSHSRRSSFSSQVAASIRRSVSPSPSMPLPAVMPSASPALSTNMATGSRNTQMYANETFTSFFRRLTFAPDGSLLFTPAGQYKTASSSQDAGRKEDEIINTVYIYTRGGLNKPPVAHLPGHKKPSIAVKCSPVYYNIRPASTSTKEITIDTGNDEEIAPLPEPVMPQKTQSSMDPPPLTSAPSPSPLAAAMPSPRTLETEGQGLAGPSPTFSLPYRIVYAVATQDAVYVYDTQQQKPLCVVNNLHYATFTDLCWTNDGQTLFMTSSDGFCSTLTFSPGELGSIYHAAPARHTPAPISITKANSAASTPQATPTMPSPHSIPAIPKTVSNQTVPPPIAPPPQPSPFATAARPASPARSMSASSVGTQSSFAFPQDPVMNNPTPQVSSLPSIAAAGSNPPNVPLFTPPQTPGIHTSVPGVVPQQIAGVKRLSNASEVSEDGNKEKRRRIAPTLMSEKDTTMTPPALPNASEKQT
ncbi:hypothetical protein AMS68_003333 [Peltaster fructicola]|uniref:CAF1B/HIR1 beta-propeller domain-containing protein n=1 Tax=Peltaster fructicola TaxID=286661 RepID=A0A6H0XT12_9PEZI|nr:hypothetical protein AMS68_003333 [Peltaster fructicola]